MLAVQPEERLFLHLLSAAIKDLPADPQLFAQVDDALWGKIETLAMRQSVPALVAEVILGLPKEMLPPRERRLRLAMQIKIIEDGNRRIHAALQAVRADYDQVDLPFILLKGQTLALYYPKPELRSSGDLDLYLYRPGDYERANAWALEQGYELQGSSVYEQLYWRDKVAVENHLYPAYFGQKRYDEALRQMLRELVETDGFAWLEIDGESYRTLPLELNAVYVFQHILHHFSYLGIGLRQVCDWVLLLMDHREELDIEHFQVLADRLDLLRPMRLFALMTVRHLGIDRDIFPFDLPTDDKSLRLADLILQDIFRGGNFGLETFAGKRFRWLWQRRWFMFRKTLMRSFKIGAVSKEHIRPTPFIAVMTRLRLLCS